MKKSTKGAIAAGAAAVLLLGGAGTLAYWSDSGTVNGGSVTAGTLSMSDPVCDAGWEYAAGNASAGEAVSLIVPGDAISKECTFTITATGDNLEATLTTPTSITIPDPADTTTFEATAAVAYAIDGAAVPATITSANNGDSVVATVTVTFPFGDVAAANANDTQGITAALDAIDITLVQTES